ncbi:MAG: PIN domain-containing protein [Candidatus Beckwithbacteria bacterium]|nr:PIN domain-containing protein [Patescibacteria group bacterium]
MKRKYFIDTNIFIEVLTGRDNTKYEDCYKLFKKIKTNQIQAMTSSVVVAELVWTLKTFYKFSRARITRGLKSIKRLRGLKIIDSYQFDETIKIFEQKSVKYIDAMIASIKPLQEKKWVIVSYDKDFDKIGIKRLEPNKI